MSGAPRPRLGEPAVPELELPGDRTDELPPGAVGAPRGSRAPCGVDLSEDVRAVECHAPDRRVVVQDGIEQRCRLTIIDHRIERAGGRAGVGAVVAPAE